MALNAFFGWRMFERHERLETSQTFQCLGNYRNLLNKVQTTADFMFNVSQELLSCSASILIAGREGENADQKVVGKEEIGTINQLAHSGKSKRFSLFNSTEGTFPGFKYGGTCRSKVAYVTVLCSNRTRAAEKAPLVVFVAAVCGAFVCGNVHRA